ncbi:MAG: tetratricopeptide repeat protein, partial [Thermoanaerobaculia bacterium]
RIAAAGDRVVVQDDGALWSPESGQVLFDFAVADLARRAEPVVRRAADRARSGEDDLDADGWYELGCGLEMTGSSDASDAYRRALEIDPGHADAHLNLGRLLHERGDLAAAEDHYRSARRSRPGDMTIEFNLGVVLQDRGETRGAIEHYLLSLDADPALADAHYNLSLLYEKSGEGRKALYHLKQFRSLVGK